MNTSAGVSLVFLYDQSPLGVHLKDKRYHPHFSGRSAPPVIRNIEHHFEVSCCALEVIDEWCSFVSPVRKRSVSSTNIMAFILNIVRVIADMNIACTGEVAIIDSRTILIDSHDGGPDPLP